MMRHRWILFLIVLTGILLLMLHGGHVAMADPPVPGPPTDPDVAKLAAAIGAAMQASGNAGNSGTTLVNLISAVMIALALMVNRGILSFGIGKKDGDGGTNHTSANGKDLVTLGALGANMETLLKEVRHDLPGKLVAPIVDTGEKFDRLISEIAAVKIRLDAIERIQLQQHHPPGRRGSSG